MKTFLLMLSLFSVCHAARLRQNLTLPCGDFTKIHLPIGKNAVGEPVWSPPFPAKEPTPIGRFDVKIAKICGPGKFTFSPTSCERMDYALHCEFRQEAKIAEIVRQVVARQNTPSAVKAICIAGPTSSGKTTFSNKVCMYLRNAGIFGQPLSIDDYYLPLEEQPKYQARREITDIDFDAPESLDWKLVHEHINALTSGQSVMMPVYNMRTSNRDPPGTHVDALPSNGVLVIEGIHALSPHFSDGLDKDGLFRIFISPVTALQIDDTNAVKTTDHRLLRKLCRDFLFRGRSASRTLGGYVKARRGEGIWVFPNQNNVDFVMNSAGEYEIPVLTAIALPLLQEVPAEDPHYAKAQEVLARFNHIDAWPTDVVPSTSLLREFIGGGAFDCH